MDDGIARHGGRRRSSGGASGTHVAVRDPRSPEFFVVFLHVAANIKHPYELRISKTLARVSRTQAQQKAARRDNGTRFFRRRRRFNEPIGPHLLAISNRSINIERSRKLRSAFSL
ncbi:hypothetical protein BHE74_00036454 [Ensete ventricosum]|nr:hypothetical protein BHE74_00036454 [Ensete ventricosum]